ncbi:MAG: hypothetical protein ACKVVT_17850 [Dehalococcoidia bacterium]
MSESKGQPSRPEPALDAETVKDLEPAAGAKDVHGGRSATTNTCIPTRVSIAGSNVT